MVTHQTIAVAEPIEICDNLTQYIQKNYSIFIFLIDIFTPITSRGKALGYSSLRGLAMFENIP